ncbi:MAG: hypothetical protein IT373_33530 [Polyangiaceae bacterium]|nr:hypothetical protein [Polyangiaceae bacterium]
MRTSLLGLVLVAATATAACDKAASTSATASSAAGSHKPTTTAAASASAPAPVGSAAPSKCGPGEGLEGDRCVPVVAPDKVGALAEEAKKLADLDAQFEKLEKVKAVLVLLDLFMKSDAWKTAEKAEPSLAGAATVVASLKDAVKKLEGLRSSIKSSGDLVKGLADTLAGTEAGRKVVAEAAQLKSEIKSKLDDVAKQLESVGQDFSSQVVEPALAEFEKVEVWVEAVCAVAVLSSDADLKKGCKEIDATTKQAKEFLAGVKDMPAQMMRELTAALEKSLGELVKGTALEKALGAPGASAAPSASPAPSASH